jgi:hypothetical protein
MTSAALRHYVDRVLDRHAASLDASFPGGFDWRRLCRDAPGMAERATGGRFDAEDLGRAHALQSRAEALFGLAHLAALAILCATLEDEPDPEAAFEAFARPPDDEEEERFEVLAAEVLGPVEESLEDEDVALDPRGIDARDLFTRVWPAVAQLVEESGLLTEVESDLSADDVEAARPVLAALARVAAILAALRWLAEYPDLEEPA